MEYPVYENQIKQQYELLGHSGHYSQLHCHNTQTKQIISRELVYGEEKIIRWAKTNNGKGNCFIGRNPRDKDGNIINCLSLSLDIDPIRSKDTAATEGEQQTAIEAVKRIQAKYDYGIVCTSGNGGLLILPFPEPVSKELAETWGNFVEEEAKKLCGGLNVQVDHTFDNARLVKLMGCVSTKGDKTDWRYARIINSAFSSDSSRRFLDWLRALPTQSKNMQMSKFTKPDGSLDRSKADMALAANLKIQGFGPDDTYKALCAQANREGREDDYERIIQKVYFSSSSREAAEMVSGRNDREIIIITPQSGFDGYSNRKPQGIPELPTGFKRIDEATFGLIRGSIFTVGARTNVGKTTFAIDVALHLCQINKRVLFVSTETTYQEIWDRYFASGTGISAFTLQHGLHLNGQQSKFDGFINDFRSKHNLAVYDGSRPNMFTVQRLLNQFTPDVLIFDYFQHVESRDVRELENFVMGLKDTAKEKNIAVLVCAQLHDGLTNMKTNKLYPPTLGSMKNSKVLNDESRVVLLLDWDRDAVQGDGPTAVKCYMAKNKGPRIDCVLKLDRSIPKFYDGE